MEYISSVKIIKALMKNGRWLKITPLCKVIDTMEMATPFNKKKAYTVIVLGYISFIKTGLRKNIFSYILTLHSCTCDASMWEAIARLQV